MGKKSKYLKKKIQILLNVLKNEKTKINYTMVFGE